jgi:hypothetical protein
LIGNPAIEAATGEGSMPDMLRYFFFHLIPTHAYAAVAQACDIGQFFSNCQKEYDNPTSAC